MKNMRVLSLCCIIIGATFVFIFYTTLSATTESPPPGILDGLVYVGHVGPKGKGPNGEDEVVFQNGHFLSTSCSKYGFGSAPYKASRSGSVIHFSAITHSPKHGQIDWQGKIVGEQLEASYRWIKERWYWFDANEEHWLKAQLKKE